MNHFAQVHRLVKAHRLVDTIDQNLTSGTGGFVNPHADAKGIAAALRKWTDAEWAQLAVIAGTHPPSATTRELVIARYVERAREPSVDDSGVFARVS